jgi:hypothetical protein
MGALERILQQHPFDDQHAQRTVCLGPTLDKAGARRDRRLRILIEGLQNQRNGETLDEKGSILIYCESLRDGPFLVKCTWHLKIRWGEYVVCLSIEKTGSHYSETMYWKLLVRSYKQKGCTF